MKHRPGFLPAARRPLRVVIGLAAVFLMMLPALAVDGKPLTVQDIMHFRQIRNTVISDNGQWIAFSARPDRGDAEGIIRSTGTDRQYSVARGTSPAVTPDGMWVAMIQAPPALDVEKAGHDKKKREALKNGLVLVNTTTGEQTAWERIKSFAFSGNGQWLIRLHDEEPAPKGDRENGKDEPPAGAPERKNGANGKEESGTRMVAHNLSTGQELTVEHVTRFAADETGRYLVYAVVTPDGQGDGLYCLRLTTATEPAVPIIDAPNSRFDALAWDKAGHQLAFLQGEKEEKPANSAKGNATSSPSRQLKIWHADESRLQTVDSLPEGWIFTADSPLTWSRDGQRLFTGLHPAPAPAAEKKETDDETIDLFDIDRLRSQRTLHIWHGRDPKIQPEQQVEWKQEQKRTYLTVFFPAEDHLVQLATPDLPDARPTENTHRVLAGTEVPYQLEATWEGSIRDYYAVDLHSGKRILIEKRLDTRPRPTLSPDGRFAAYYRDGQVFLLDLSTGERRSLTAGLTVPFADEDWDYPGTTPGYGFAGWLENGAALLAYDKYDIWVLPTDGTPPSRLTAGEGRAHEVEYRVIRTDREQQFFTPDETLLLSAYSDREKTTAFCQARLGHPGVTRLLDGPKRYTFQMKAKDADVLLFTREDFHEFPDLWVAGMNLQNPRKLTGVNPQIAEFAWGTPELVEWLSDDGKPLQGILIKPGNYVPGKRYPVIVYFYRFFTQRLYEFNQMVVNHRPNFPFYTSNGYALFLPDIRFTVGTPGQSAVKALVPGVQKLIEMGVADPKAIGLHGHSWSGYQTAFAVTQTDIFACAVAGAPVSNMTSAYSGIRWESGLARQFQYEKSQSRIGANLWQRRDLYIDNSPVFFADRIHTPLLIEHGDADGAVPWYQSIEFYLALRRLGKDVVFLEYVGEPHHLQKYPNKVDYTIRMKEYFDHYLKGAPAPDWLLHGEPYRGK